MITPGMTPVWKICGIGCDVRPLLKCGGRVPRFICAVGAIALLFIITGMW